jgi:uncharacterized protein
MRLTDDEQKAIVASVLKFDTAAEVFLYGSPVDDSKRGGDIDILIKSDVLEKRMLGLIEDELFRHIEEQKVDLVLTGKTSTSSFAEMVLARGAVRLCQTKS